MRFSGWCATALAAASLASAQTVTITRTVERVQQTSWPSASMSASGWSNGTHPQATGTGAWSSSSVTATVVPATGAAVPVRLDTIGYAALVGVVGLAAL
jgi:hypothetical protein